MGYNSIVLILNDELHRIKDDENYGEKLYYAVTTHDRTNPAWHSVAPGARVLSVEHADVTHLILAGGNTGKVVGSTYNSGRFWQPNDTHAAMKGILQGVGYSLARRKSKVASQDVVDQVAELARPKQEEVAADHAKRMADENRLLKLEIERLQARVKELGG